MADAQLNLVRGTLDLLVLKALESGPMHGYAVSQWIGQVTGGVLLVEEGSLYPALHRLERKGWIAAEWGVSATGRRARFYRLTEDGVHRLETELDGWRRYAHAIERAIAAGGPAS
ncbi:MAG TPA: PadR family transcriptional regulator [Longimicrobiales bacterium]|nr:PadR family transcriptional regulator [Longimicrobiales bacterium]